MKKYVCSIFLAISAQVALAGGGPGGGGATEATQLQNNSELIASYMKLDDTYTRQGLQYAKQVDQYKRQLLDAAKLGGRILSRSDYRKIVDDTAKLLENTEGLGASSAKIAQKLTQAYGSTANPNSGIDAFRQWLKIGRQTIAGQLQANGVAHDSQGSNAEKIRTLSDKLDSADVDGQVKTLQTVGEINLTMVEQLQQLNTMNLQNQTAIQGHMAAVQAEKQGQIDAEDAVRKQIGEYRNCTTKEALAEIRKYGFCK